MGRLFDQFQGAEGVRVQVALVALMSGRIDGAHKVLSGTAAVVVDVTWRKAHDLASGQRHTSRVLLVLNVTVVVSVNLYADFPDMACTLAFDLGVDVARDQGRITAVIDDFQVVADVIGKGIVAVIVLTTAFIFVDKNFHRVLLPVLAAGVDDIVGDIKQQIQMLWSPHRFVFAAEILRAARLFQVFKTGPGNGHFHPRRIVPYRINLTINHRCS